MPDDAPARLEQEGQEPWARKMPKRARRLTRDGALFLLGIAIIIKEAFIDPTPSVPLLYLAAGLTGAPVFLRLDEAARQGGKK